MRRDAIKRILQKEASQASVEHSLIQIKHFDKDFKGDGKFNTILAINDECEVINSEDELDQDDKSMKENENDDEVIVTNLIRNFANSQEDFQQEIQQATETHGLSPSGRKEKRQIKNNQSGVNLLIQVGHTQGPYVDVYDDQILFLEYQRY